MTSAVPGTKKTALCRYFVNTGSCIYGDECQFLHQNPGPGCLDIPQKHFPNGSVSSHDNQGSGLPDGMGGNGDQFYSPSFGMENSVPDFQPFPRQRQMQRPQRSMLNPNMPPSPNPKSFGPPGPPGPRMDNALPNDFSALNLSVPNNMKAPNPMVNEFIPKSLSHSASSPSFSSFAGMPPMSTAPPTSHIREIHFIAGIPFSTNTSPNASPGLSPSGSPLMMRRTGSPVNPFRQSAGQPPPSSNSKNPTTIQENVGGTTYFYSPEDFTPQYDGIVLPNFSMYPGLPPHIGHMKVKANMPQFYMPDELKMEILNRHALTLAQIDPAHCPDIPREVDNYHNLFPLEPPPSSPMQKSSTFSYSTTCYKAVNTKDGLTYCMRRVHGFRLANTKCMSIIDMWKKMYHPNIVQLKEVFTTKAFGDHSIVFVYDFYPGAETLMSRHFSNNTLNGYMHPFGMDSPARHFSSGKVSSMNGPRQHAGLLPESLIWAYVVQLSSALRAIHAAGLACRALDPTKIIIYSKSRLRLNCVGIFDVLTFDQNQPNPLALLQHYQQEDLVSLGKIVLALACNSVMAIQRDNLQSSMELVARNYSADLKNLILYLLTNQNRPRTINDIMPMIGARFYTQLDAAQLRSDVIENELAKEVENGRIFRLLCKLGTICERPEFNMDPQWSETGDRYMLKLFRDYLFHQVDENGAPWVDMAHVVQSLNKFDSGVPEKICLMSRDEQSVLVVSYAELKQFYEAAFNELMTAGQPSGFS
ncbi:hypothetical protein ScPMuIL_010087 [Solemya velum]